MEILKFGSPKAEPFTLFLHGFPSIRSKQNRDIAETTAKATDGRAEVLLYDGLGFSPGVFSFEQCLKDVRAYAKTLFSERGETIDLVGHSWGGFLALVLAAEYPSRIRRLVLMSPLLSFATAEQARPSFEETLANNPMIHLGDVEKLAQEFERVGANYPTRKLLAQFPESIEALFLQAKDDAVTPSSVAQSCLPFFRKIPLFELVETDHSFLIERPKISQRIAEFIASGQ